MNDRHVSKVLENQSSLSEWIQKINHKDLEALVEEDNYKRERLRLVNKIIGLPYDKPVQFEARAITHPTKEFKKFLKEQGQELCAIRLIPKPGNPTLPKLRMRGKSIKDVVSTWFKMQKIDPEKYTVDFVPHSEQTSWVTIFIVNDHGVFGEIYSGSHHVLTQGFHAGKAPTTFSFDFSQWILDPPDNSAQAYLTETVDMLRVSNIKLQRQLREKVAAEFTPEDYLKGYFETTFSPSNGTWFIDYNRVLGKYYNDFQLNQNTVPKGKVLVQGRSASSGKASGRVVTADLKKPLSSFPENAILVCKMTSPDYLPFMQKAAAIVTDQGGILCHAAIVARELKKPCIVGTGNATTVLDDGDYVTVDASKGVVIHT